MPHPTDKFDAETTLPDPELNPLLNPLLAAHMGRWAEVYFTSPPEKRAEAVSGLLRELEKESSSQPPSDRVIDITNQRKGIEPGAAPRLPLGTVEGVSTCDACGHDNQTEQKFCGMCGAPLKFSPELRQPQVAETAPISEPGWREPEPYNSVEYLSKPALNSAADEPVHDVQVAAWPVRETYLPRFAREAEPVPYRYRLYIGVAVAVLLVALVYLGWRGTEASSSDSSQSSASRTIPAALPDSPAPAPASPVSQPKAIESAPAENKPAAAPVQSQNQSQTPTRREPQEPTADSQPAPQLNSAAADSPALASGQSGAEELALAERYLKGNRNTARDSGEAAQWLWKAVAKGNVPATITLSDLYLRGDGVAQSCDQARLLLVAAARKGGAAAAERLRNLQAFGCQ